jgi:YesN/AraC family two-component response regulator
MERVLYIKNMVCPRCERVVKEDLEALGLKVKQVELGKAMVEGNEDLIYSEKIGLILEKAGFELLEDREQKLIESIKVELMRYLENHDLQKFNTSGYLEKALGHNYGYLSRLFSQLEGITIEKFLIRLKVEKVKELLKYDEASNEEIAFRLNYSSVAHLSKQFKDVTGLTTTEFRKQNRLIS